MAHDSNAPKNQENDNDAEDESQSSGRSIAPVSAMRPTGQHSQKRQNQDHDQYSSKHEFLLDDEIVDDEIAAQPLPKLHPQKTYIEMLIAMPTLGYLRLKR